MAHPEPYGCIYTVLLVCFVIVTTLCEYTALAKLILSDRLIFIGNELSHKIMHHMITKYGHSHSECNILIVTQTTCTLSTSNLSEKNVARGKKAIAAFISTTTKTTKSQICFQIDYGKSTKG